MPRAANGKTYDFHILPSGLVNPSCTNLVGSGCVVHVPSFFKELAALEKHGLDTTDRIFVSDRAHVTLDLHTLVDGLEEVELGQGFIGTTKKGIGPTYSTKMTRSGIRMTDIFDAELFETKLRRLADGFKKRFGDLLTYDADEEIARFQDYREKLRPFVIDQIPLLKSAKEMKAPILVEGANAIMLDIDYGTYPFVTSSNTGLGGVLTGLSLGWRSIKEVIGVVKAYTTRVGSGPFPTEQLNEVGNTLQEVGREFGVTTGRRRRCGWLDLVLVKYSHDVNDYTALNLTKLDILDGFDEIRIATQYSYKGQVLESVPASNEMLANVEVRYETMPGWKTATTGAKTFEELPENARNYVLFIEKFVGVRIKWIGTAPLDVIKIRLQLQIHSLTDPLSHQGVTGPIYKGTLGTFKSIVRSEGITGLWKGNIPAEALYITYGAVQFSGYRFVSSYLHTLPHIPDTVESFISGAAAGTVATTVTYPLDLLRTRFAAQGTEKIYASLLASVRDITRHEGPFGFFQGLGAGVGQIVPYMGLFFAGYETLKIPLARLDLPFGSGDATAGVLASVMAKTAVFPLDTIRKRLQVQGPMRGRYVHRNIPLYKGIAGTFRAILQREGVRGLYRGLPVSLLKAAPASAVTMWTYERAMAAMQTVAENVDG
ncbi:hypothetical protein B0A49_04295 [Cryomyces minteri]|uniref:Adenylosuccinate synthetase n=1 Tax=Cryomyces minteri TaxID=331657 RepID=A0A4U0X6U8_9PEZI|nr:hypothetical protein B0A49_04295 [Cryomyces minteri]